MMGFGRQSRMPKRAAQVSRRRFVGGLVLAALAAPSLARAQIARIDPSQPFSAPTIDMALVLAVDCSRSIDADEYRLQAMGYAAAFRSERVRKAALGGRRGAIAVAMTQWGGQRAQELVLDWTLVADPAGLENLAARLAVQPRRIDDDATSISGAIDHARRQFATLPYAAERRVIDVSGDGINNQGRLPRFARDEAVDDGIGINGLPILTEYGTLDRYFRAEVIGGPGAFVVPASRFADFAPAIAHKIAQEVAGLPDGPRVG
jgi:hypothetical protein